jgi:hypothetical protein
MRTQNEMILKHLQTHKRGITAMQALNKFGCMRLASRISELRRMGYIISREMIAVKDRDGDVRYVANYKLME